MCVSLIADVFGFLQVGGVFRDVRRNPGQFEVGAVHHGAFTATSLRTHQILETLPTQPVAVVLLTCRGRATVEDTETERRKRGRRLKPVRRRRKIKTPNGGESCGCKMLIQNIQKL